MSTLTEAAESLRRELRLDADGFFSPASSGYRVRIGCWHVRNALTACGGCYARALGALGEIARGGDGPAIARALLDVLSSEAKA